MSFSLTAVNAPEVAHAYGKVADRVRDQKAGFASVAELLERAEEKHFSSLNGRYVLTGATKASLTQTAAPGAIRLIHAGGLTFGSSVPQAHYLTKSPHDPDASQVAKAHGRSAVLVFPESVRKLIPRLLLNRIVEGF